MIAGGGPLFQDIPKKHSQTKPHFLDALCGWSVPGISAELLWCLKQINEKEAWEKALERLQPEFRFDDSLDYAIRCHR